MTNLKFIEPKVEFLTGIDGEKMLKDLERIGRVCYKSENKITDNSCYEFIKNIMKRGHESIIEHKIITVLVTCDRGVSHQIVRHRLASYAQESTRYCDYTKMPFTFIIPNWFNPEENKILKEDSYINDTNGLFMINRNGLRIRPKTITGVSNGMLEWAKSMKQATMTYEKLIKESNWTPQQARSVLPNSLKTEIVMTMNLREWRHYFNQRIGGGAHPQIEEISIPILTKFSESLPVVFNDIALAKGI